MSARTGIRLPAIYYDKEGKMGKTATAILDMEGITKGRHYNIIKRDGNFIQIILDDGRTGFFHVGAFEIQ